MFMVLNLYDAMPTLVNLSSTLEFTENFISGNEISCVKYGHVVTLKFNNLKAKFPTGGSSIDLITNMPKSYYKNSHIGTIWNYHSAGEFVPVGACYVTYHSTILRYNFYNTTYGENVGYEVELTYISAE